MIVKNTKTKLPVIYLLMIIYIINTSKRCRLFECKESNALSNHLMHELTFEHISAQEKGGVI